MSLYERIKNRRNEINMSQEELATKLGYKSRSTIAKIEAGINDIPQSKIQAFADALNTTPGYLMGWDDLRETVSNSEQETNFINALKLIGCDIEYKSWLIPPKNFELDENECYEITYDDISFNVSVSEYKEFVKDIKSYLRFKVHELYEKRKAEDQEHLLPNAAHEIEGASDEDRAYDDALMDDDNF